MTIPLGLLQLIQQEGIDPTPRAPGSVVPRPAPIDLDRNARVQGRRTERPGAFGSGTQQDFLTDETLLALARSAGEANKLETRSFKDQILDRVLGQSTPQRIVTEDARRADLLTRLRALCERL